MLDIYEEETRWIREEAKRIADKTGAAYSSVLFRGLNAYNEGCDDEWIRQEMLPGIQAHGTG